MAESKSYRMPHVELGQIVWWYPAANKKTQPQPGIVSQVNPQSVCVNLVDPNTYTLLIRDGVKHADDPTIQFEERREMGGWDFTDKDKRLAALERQLAEFLLAQGDGARRRG